MQLYKEKILSRGSQPSLHSTNEWKILKKSRAFVFDIYLSSTNVKRYVTISQIWSQNLRFWICIQGMAILVVEFSSEGYKIRKVFGWKSTVVKSNHWILWIGVMGRCQKGQNLTFKVNCYIKSHRHLSDFFFIEEYKFRRTFLLLTFCHNINP